MRSAAVPTPTETVGSSGNHSRAAVCNGRVVANRLVCKEHYRLTCRVPEFAQAEPGQFVHLAPQAIALDADQTSKVRTDGSGNGWIASSNGPLLRRAFSIAGLARTPDGVEIDVIYRVVGKSTAWLASLAVDASLSLLGPLGGAFPIRKKKRIAWLVCGGVGLPPMLWLSQALRRADRDVVAFCGTRSADLLAISLDPDNAPATDARRATLSAEEFARHQVPVVISTDNGSLGFHGHIGAALAAYADANLESPDEIVVYTCGPEIMMRGVAELCEVRGIECYACMERSMACGTGLCQSCVVSVHDESAPDGWRYQLCCTEGPVFDTTCIKWD